MAADRRKIELTHAPKVTAYSSNKAEKKEVETVPVETKSPSKFVTSMASTSTEIFKKELRKSLVISAFIILVEIGIYLAQNSGIPITNFL